MTDEELIARLRENQAYEWQDPIWETRLAAADRFEQLAVTNEALIAELSTCRMAQVVMDNTVADLEAKLAKAVEALDEAVYLLKPDEKDMMRQAGVYRIVTTLAEIKGESHE